MLLDFSNLNLAYLVGALGISVEWWAYYCESGRSFRFWSALAALLWAVQYGLLEAWTAGLTMASTAVRTCLSGTLLTEKYKGFISWVFLLGFAILTFYSWQGPVSLLPAFAVCNTTVALFHFNNRSMRIALLASSLAWIVNDWFWQAWPALLAEAVAMLINSYTIRKLMQH